MGGKQSDSKRFPSIKTGFSEFFSVDAISLIFFDFRNYKFGPCSHIVMTETRDSDVHQNGGK